MAISFVASGSTVVGTTALALPYPPSLSANDLLILAVMNKYPAAGSPTASPGNWTGSRNAESASGGLGTAGVDAGSALVRGYYKLSTGLESGCANVLLTGANVSIGKVLAYRIGAGKTWGIGLSGGAKKTATTAWAVTASADPGIANTDVVLALVAVNGDVALSASQQAMTATGISAWGTTVERADTNSAGGDDMAMQISEHPVTTGSSTAAPVFSMRSSASGTSTPAGAVLFFRMREVGGAPPASGGIAAGGYMQAMGIIW